MPWRYLIALGSNRRHHRHGGPALVLGAALAAMASAGLEVIRASSVLTSVPMGPSLRRYANSAAVIESSLAPAQLLTTLKEIERAFGRRPGGQRWSARVLDLDIVLWSGGSFAAAELIIPHRLFRTREFVLRPAAVIAGSWRDPLTGLTLRQLHARLTRR